MTALDVLRRVRVRLSDESAWTTGSPARGPMGVPVSPTSPMAREWCLMGATAAEGDKLEAYETLLARVPNGMGVSTFNDGSTHTEVLELLDKTIADLEAGQ